MSSLKSANGEVKVKRSKYKLTCNITGTKGTGLWVCLLVTQQANL